MTKVKSITKKIIAEFLRFTFNCVVYSIVLYIFYIAVHYMRLRGL